MSNSWEKRWDQEFLEIKPEDRAQTCWWHADVWHQRAWVQGPQSRRLNACVWGHLCGMPQLPSRVESVISLIHVASACWRRVTLKVNRGGSITGFFEGEINGSHSSYLYILLIDEGTDAGVCNFAVIGDKLLLLHKNNTDCYRHTWAAFKDLHSSWLVLILSSKCLVGAGRVK